MSNVSDDVTVCRIVGRFLRLVELQLSPGGGQRDSASPTAADAAEPERAPGHKPPVPLRRIEVLQLVTLCVVRGLAFESAATERSIKRSWIGRQSAVEPYREYMYY